MALSATMAHSIKTQISLLVFIDH